MSYPQISHFLIAHCTVFTGAAGLLPIFWANYGKQMCDDAPCGRGGAVLGAAGRWRGRRGGPHAVFLAFEIRAWPWRFAAGGGGFLKGARIFENPELDLLGIFRPVFYYEYGFVGVQPSFSATQPRTLCRAAGSAAALVPPAMAMSGLPPPSL